MKYFIPEWDDRVDPKYDFITDTHSKEHHENPTMNDVYTWDIFGIDKVPLDGVLVSIITMNKKKTDWALKEGIHKVLHLPQDFEIMGDCGAFGYIKEEIPPYDPIEILDYYDKVGFNYGVSVDHLVVTGFQEQKDNRMKLTYENGIKSFNEWKKKFRDRFQLVVAVQGLEIKDYLKMYDDYIKHGIDHFGFGGLVRSPSTFISELIDELIDRIKKTKSVPEYLHFFGLSRSALFPKFQELEELGTTVGFDSASYLRKAWLSSPEMQMNYLSLDGTGYTAIRIPTTKRRKGTNQDKESNDLEKLNQECLTKLRRYDQEKEQLESLLSYLNQLNKTAGIRPDILSFYKKTLLEKPWKKCDCPICTSIGIQTVIFRGNNRNRRRGFHNTYAFYNILKNPQLWLKLTNNKVEENKLLTLKKDQKVLIITGCTKKKLSDTPALKIQAKKLYQGRLFKNVRRYAEKMGFDYVIISAKYGLVFPEESIGGYEQVLKTKDDVENIRPLVEKRVGPLLKQYQKIVIIAGKHYRDVLANLWDPRFVVIRSKGYGHLASMVDKATPKEKPLGTY